MIAPIFSMIFHGRFYRSHCADSRTGLDMLKPTPKKQQKQNRLLNQPKGSASHCPSNQRCQARIKSGANATRIISLFFSNRICSCRGELADDLLGLPRRCNGIEIHLYKIDSTNDNSAPLGRSASDRTLLIRVEETNHLKARVRRASFLSLRTVPKRTDSPCEPLIRTKKYPH